MLILANGPWGGDGDNMEGLMFGMDVLFELEDKASGESQGFTCGAKDVRNQNKD